MIFSFIQEHSQEWSVCVMCETLGLSSQGFYAWHSRGTSSIAFLRAYAVSEGQLFLRPIDPDVARKSMRLAVCPGRALVALWLLGAWAALCKLAFAPLVLTLPTRQCEFWESPIPQGTACNVMNLQA
jgi:hypothetical protein